MNALKEYSVGTRGQVILDGEYSGGQGIANDCLLKYSPLPGRYVAIRRARSLLFIHKNHVGKKELVFTEKHFSKRICASYRRDINDMFSSMESEQQYMPYAVFLDDELNEVWKVPISVAPNMGLKVEVAKNHSHRIIAIRITRCETESPPPALRPQKERGLNYEKYMPLCSFRIVKPKANDISFFDEKGILQKIGVETVRDVQDAVKEYPQLGRHVRFAKDGSVFVKGCNSYKNAGTCEHLSRSVRMEIKKITDSLSAGVTIESFEKALEGYSISDAEQPVRKRLTAGAPKRFWEKKDGEIRLHSILVEMMCSGGIEDTDRFLTENGNLLFKLAEEAVADADFAGVEVEKLRFTRAHAWPSGGVTVNFFPEAQKLFTQADALKWGLQKPP